MIKSRKNGLLTKIRNILLIAVIAAWQVAFAGAPFLGTVNAGSNPSADLDQCRNGSIAAPDLCNDTTSPLGWQNGDSQATQAHWREGDSLPYRMLFDNLDTSSSHSVTIQWDTTKGSKHAIDYLTTFNRTETSADPCYGVSGCGSPSTFAIPTDPNVTAAGPNHPQVAGNFTLYNGTITSVGAYTLTGTYAGDSSTSITINFMASTANPVLAWSGHIASQIDWGLGNSASAISGSPYHTRLLDLDGKGGNQDRALAAAAVFPTPAIVTQASSASVHVGDTVTDTATLTGNENNPLTGTVDFFVCGPNASSNPDCTTGGTQVGGNVSLTQTTLGANKVDAVSTATSSAYTVMNPGKYCFRAEYTPATDAPYSPQNHTDTTLECFTATFTPGSITIEKDAIPDSSQAFHFSTSGLSTDATGFDLTDDTTVGLPAKVFNNLAANGTYTITEDTISGWDFGGISCTDQAGTSTIVKSDRQVSITLSPGDNVTCKYTNRERGTLTVHKVTYPANDTTNFSVTANTSDGNIAGNATHNDLSTSHDVVYDVSQGTYSVTEAAASGWSEDDSDCASVVVSANNLNPSCTIYNTKLAKLKIVKATNPSSSSQSFLFGASGPSITVNNNAFTLDTNGVDNTYLDNYQYVDLMPGSYSVSETEPSNWTLTGLTCSGTNDYSNPSNTTDLSVTLAAGDNVTCTFTNTEYSSISGSKLEVNADSSVVQNLSGWTIKLLLNGSVVATTTTDGSGMFSFNNLMSGNYTLVEVTQNGWTQIYAPNGISLTAGQDSTDNNFGNFQNASISGYKFNDLNGNGQWDISESGLQGWTITLYDNGGSGALLNHQVAQTTTGANGIYSFTNLPPTNYKVCETPQTGWTQTYPSANDGCNLVTVALSGHEYTNNNFGNQGRGTITVVKNVDTDGDGQIDQSDVTNWTWGYSGTLGSGSDIATGSANSQAVAAGDYTISENQKTDYHVTASSCSGEQDATVSTSKSVTVSPGEDVVCTFTNTRDTGTIEVIKDLRPDTDAGKFNLKIDGTTEAANVGDKGTTGKVQVLTGSHNVSETAGTNTSLNDYTSSYSCVDGRTTLVSGSGASSSSFSVTKDSDIVCTFINTRLGQVTGSKFNDINGNHTWDQSEPGLQGWTIKLYSCHDQVGLALNIAPAQVCDTLVDSTQTAQDGSYIFGDLQDGDYKVCEVQQSGWTQTYPQTADGCTYFTIDLSTTPAQSVTANFGNRGRGTITVVKNVDTDGDGNVDQTNVTDWTWNIDGVGQNNTGSSNHVDVAAGSYTVNEIQKTDYHVTASSCTGENDNTVSTGKSVTVSPGEDVVCTFTNTRDTGHITVIKNLYPNDDAGKFNLNIDGTSYATNIGDSGTTGSVRVLTGSHNVSETAGTSTSLNSYDSWFWCTNEESGAGTSTDSFTVNSGDDVTCYFTNVRLGTLKGVKFEDMDANGVKDQGEPHLSGWTIDLYSCNQQVFSLLNLNSINSQVSNNNCGPNLFQTTQTDANGAYQFDNLSDGDYKVCEVQQSGWTQTYPADNNGCTLFTIDLNLETGQPGQIVTADFGNFKNGSISGFKFSDPNGNGQFDSGEVKLGGWTINLNLSDGNGGWTKVGSAVTDSTGAFSFTDLAPGNYQVCEVPQDGWIRIFPTGSDCQTVDINQSGQAATELFANQKKVVPQVLAAELVNTGEPAILSVIAGLITISLVAGLSLATKQNKR
jgi:hypothetical protein